MSTRGNDTARDCVYARVISLSLSILEKITKTAEKVATNFTSLKVS